ncbi:MAG: response regulator [Epsilonproteobacteria bacterium]|nr:response regulator [Campylobacterota bacterium]
MIDNIETLTSLHLRNEVQFFVFSLEENGDKYAMNIFKIQEILKYKDKIVDIMADVPFVDGVVNIRGIAIPVVDLRKWFNYFGVNTNLDNYAIQSNEYLIMVCDFSGVLIAVRIYKAYGLLVKSWDDFVRNDNISKHQKIIGYVKDNNEIIQVVDMEKMVDEALGVEAAKVAEIDVVNKLGIKDKIILVADDSSAVLKVMEKILKKLEVNFEMFKNGEELLNALFKIPKEKIFAIITDLEMPKVSGFEVIKRVKNSEYKDIPIIVNSSMSGESNEELAKSLNADGFISKSNPKEIEEALRSFIDERGGNS